MKLILVVTMAIFGLIVAHAAPQKRQETDAILPADTSDEAEPLPQGGPDGKPIRKCTWKDFPADKLRSGDGGKDDYYRKLALICQTNEADKHGYTYAWLTADGSGSYQHCKLEDSKPYSNCDSRGENCHPGAGAPDTVAPVSDSASSSSLDAFKGTAKTELVDASSEILLTGGHHHHKDQVCSIKGVYTYCVPEGVLYIVHYHSNQKEGYVVDSITSVKDKRCKARPHHHHNDCDKGAFVDRDGNKCPGVAPVSGPDSAGLDGPSF